MKKILLKRKIQKEVSKMTLDMVESKEWLDKDTWINYEVKWVETLKELFKGFFDFDETDKEDYWLCIEYWKDENKIQYLLQCDDDTININEYVKSKYIDNLVLTAIEKSKN